MHTWFISLFFNRRTDLNICARIGLFFILLISIMARADSYVANVTVQAVNTVSTGFVLFNVTGSTPAGVCTYFGFNFRFDGTTAGGKAMLSNLLAAYSAGKSVNLSYTNSTTPGTTDANGCTEASMAVPWSIVNHL